MKKKKIKEWELFDICDSFKFFQYNIFNRDTGHALLRQKGIDIRKILPDEIGMIYLFEDDIIPEIDIYTKSDTKSDEINSGLLIHVLLHKINLK